MRNTLCTYLINSTHRSCLAPNSRRHNNSNAADGQKPLVLSSSLLAAADLSRYAAELLAVSEWADLNVGWVSVNVTHAGVGFRVSTQPTQVLYLIALSYLPVVGATYQYAM